MAPVNGQSGALQSFGVEFPAFNPNLALALNPNESLLRSRETGSLK
jgi:hypothetical protein